MAQLIVMHDQLSATGDDITEIKNGKTPTDALMQVFPQGLNPEAVQVYVNQKRMILPSESEQHSDELLKPMISDDIIIVVMEAKGVETAYLVAIAFVSAAISIALAPSIPGDAGKLKESPNNNLQGQTNIARPYQAYPLIFGSPISYPDLTGEPNVEYVDNIKIVRQLMNVGVGLFDVSAIRAGETPIDNFLGASATIYEPVNKIVTVPEVVETFAINEIDGQEIEGADVGIVVGTFNLTENGANLATFIGGIFEFQVVKDAESDSLKVDFDAALNPYTLKVNYKTDTIGDGGAYDVDGSGVISTMVLDGGGTFYTITLNGFNGPKNVDISSSPQYSFDVPFITENTISSEVGPINVGLDPRSYGLAFALIEG